MNDSIYEEYMRSVLGYQPMYYNNTYDTNYDNFEMYNMSAMDAMQIQELESCYPEIYRIVYPMIQRASEQNTRPITKELIDSMTEEIYLAIDDNEIAENRTKEQSKNTGSEIKENRQINIRNRGLNDLIRILLLRELLGRPGFPGGRPPQFPRPPRPPMRPPMGPGPRPQPRPGMGTFNRHVYNSFDDRYNLYENNL